jgi:hypothetical protein
MLSNNGVFPLPTTYITGVASYKSGDILSNFIDFNNIGRNFLVRQNFAEYFLRVGFTGLAISGVTNLLGSSAGETSYIFDTSNTLYSTGILPNPARISAKTTFNNPTADSFTSANTNLVMNILGKNITSSTAVITNCNIYYYHPTLGPLKPYVDYPSISVMATGGVNTSNGVRVESGTAITNPTNYGGNFQHTSNLATTYSNELQMVNGNYVTKATIPTADAYRNYSNYYGNNNVNYSGILNNNTVRFVTFKYTQNRNGAPTNTIRIQIDYGGRSPFPISSQLFTNNILFQYKLNNYKSDSGTIIANPNSNPTNGSKTTVWLNGNEGFQSGFDENSYTTPGTTGLNTAGFTNTATDRYLAIRQDTYNLFDLYIRIGIPMNEPYSFKSISIISYTG